MEPQREGRFNERGLLQHWTLLPKCRVEQAQRECRWIWQIMFKIFSGVVGPGATAQGLRSECMT